MTEGVAILFGLLTMRSLSVIGESRAIRAEPLR